MKETRKVKKTKKKNLLHFGEQPDPEILDKAKKYLSLITPKNIHI